MFYTKDRHRLLGSIAGVKEHSTCTLMDTQVPINRHGREWRPGQAKVKQLQAPKYLMTFHLQEGEEIMGITMGYLEDEEVRRAVKAGPAQGGQGMPFLVINAILVWVPPKLIT